MRTNALTKKIGTAILGLSLMSGIGLGFSTTAQAQDPWWRTQQNRRDRNRDWDYRDDRGRRRGRNNDDYPNYGGSFQLRQTALNAGYNEGIKEGRKNRQRNRYRNLNDFGAYRNATKDYDSRYGDRELYREYYRLAFERGFEAGLNGY
jgi:hypothetical protein